MYQVKLTELNYAEGARYLGYGTSTPDSTVMELMRECSAQICETAVPCFVYRIFPLEEEKDRLKLQGTACTLSGTSIREHLNNCHSAVLLCATLSSSLDRLIRKTEIQDMAKAVIMDAMAGVAVEQLCDKAEKMIKEQYEKSKTGYFTWRFGFGYGDLPLEEERMALRLLEAEKQIGVNLNESLIMFPKKTVACVIGISSEKLGAKKRNCLSCNMYERCSFRMRGERCGVS